MQLHPLFIHDNAFEWILFLFSTISGRFILREFSILFSQNPLEIMHRSTVEISSTEIDSNAYHMDLPSVTFSQTLSLYIEISIGIDVHLIKSLM